MKTCQDEKVLTRPNMKERVKALREEAILDAAQELIESKGYAAMTLDDITEHVGISKPTLYLHFKSKEDIVLHVKKRCLVQTMDYLVALDPKLPASERLRDFVRWAVDRRFGANSMLFQDMAQHILPQADESSPCGRIEMDMCASIVDLMAEAQAEGGIRRDIPPIMLSALLLGFVKNWRVDELLQTGELDISTITESWMHLLTSQ